jgi:hypothetical protein
VDKGVRGMKYTRDLRCVGVWRELVDGEVGRAGSDVRGSG